MSEHREAVREVVLNMLKKGVRTQPLELTVDLFIQQAEVIRDALEPFDSGVRVKHVDFPVSHYAV